MFSIIILMIDLVSGREFHVIDRMVYLSSVMVTLFWWIFTLDLSAVDSWWSSRRWRMRRSLGNYCEIRAYIYLEEFMNHRL